MGVPSGTPRDFSMAPMKAYLQIYDEFFRDQDLVAEPDFDTYTGAAADDLKTIAWEKDYLTTARPWPAKGPQVTIPLGDTAEVIPTGAMNFSDGQGSNQTIRNVVQAAPSNLQSGAAGVNTNDWIYASGLEVDLTGAAAAEVNDVRRAFAIQRYQEARAQYGSRLTEYLRYAFGVRSSDARLQRPEYIAGGKTVINFSEVLNTASDPAGTTLDPLGS